ncbi:hypothetical protein [Egicoccus sp. AB-alg6-2]|uniref:hypothetical protein n=1 Tax=Egicoccus sp. AB-alg6-2 TaxID=3242692 RepID=UPI00359F078B
MASDLGAWPAEQASVLLEVLQRDGLTPEAKRTREGIHVLVPDGQSDQAHQVLAANMDVIARAARPGGGTARGRRGRRKTDPTPRPASRGGSRRHEEASPRLASERLMRAGPAIALFLVALLVAGFLPGLAFPILVIGAFVGIWLLGKRTMDDRDE